MEFDINLHFAIGFRDDGPGGWCKRHGSINYSVMIK